MKGDEAMYDYGIQVAFLGRYVLGCTIGVVWTVSLIVACWIAVRTVHDPYTDG